MSPDLICVLDTVSGNAFGTETIRYGMRVTVIALPAPPVFLTPKGLAARRPPRLRLRPRLPLGVRCSPRRRNRTLSRIAGDGVRSRSERWVRAVRDGAATAPSARPSPRWGRGGSPCAGRRMRRIGIDVGGTNTDAVLLEDGRVVHAVKTPTTARRDRRHRRGARSAAAPSRGWPGRDRRRRHRHDAFRQCRRAAPSLSRVAAIRIGMPAGASLPPFCDWPAELAELVAGGGLHARRRP